MPNWAAVTLEKYLFGMLNRSKDQQTYLMNVDVVGKTRVALRTLRKEASCSETLELLISQ